MKSILIIIALASAGMAVTSCKKKTNNDPATPVGGTSQLHTFMANNLESNTQHFSVNASTGAVITGAHGTVVIIDGGTLLNGSNQIVTGNVDVELVEIYDRASMVLLNKPTMGRLANGDLSALISGGEYYLRITQNGQELHSSNGVRVLLPGDNTGGIQFGMSQFDGVIDGDGNLVWELEADTVGVIQDSAGGQWNVSYEILDGSWGWTNVDRFYYDPRPKTTLKVKLPDGYDNTNCEVYLTYDGEPTALASLDSFTQDGFFSEHYGQIPIGLEVHFIAVTMINNQLHYAIQGVTITSNHIEYITTWTPITQSDLATMINNLP